MSSSNKFTNLKHAMSFIRDEMNSDDRLAVITFDSSSVTLHQLLRMTDVNKVRVENVLSGVQPSGGTSILSGLKAALNILNSRLSRNPITTVFLLTDGVDGSYATEKQHAAKAIKDLGASLFVFGFGADHDSAHLNMIANAAEGSFSFVEQSDMVIDAFGGALGSQQSICAREICVTLIAQAGVKIKKLYCGNYRYNISVDQNEAVIHFSNLLQGEMRDIMVSLQVPAVSDDSEHSPLINSRLTYRTLEMNASSKPLQVQGEPCVVQRVNADQIDASILRSIPVDVQINRALFAEATSQILAAADANDYGNASRKVQTCLSNITSSSSYLAGDRTSVALVQELNESALNCSSALEYNKGGKARTIETGSDMCNQRKVYSKSKRSMPAQDNLDAGPDLYQSVSSSACQTKFLSKKSANINH